MSIVISRSLPPKLRDLQKQIETYAREFQLVFCDTIFEMLTYEEMSMVAAYSGFPNRYPHWHFGMEYEHLSKSYAYGLHKIYEMVINNVPCYAYLLESNSLTDHKLVMAHVYAHCDFFTNNAWFQHTDRKMIDHMADHAMAARQHADRHGVNRVESFIDVCLSMENLIDPYSTFIPRQREAPADQPAEESLMPGVPKLPSQREYMESFINPKQFLDEQVARQKKQREKVRKFPAAPERDILLFMLEHAPLENWQREVLEMIRQESYYFMPQGLTKIMNEGWASYWHSTIMTRRALTDAEIIDYADHHSGTMATSPTQLNPYKLGLELFRDIEDRWNKGRFGKEYQECDDFQLKKGWDRKLGLGREKIFEVRRFYNDVAFLDEFLTEEFCREHKFFVYDFNPETQRWEISSRKFDDIKSRLLRQLTNLGRPVIVIDDANFQNRGELLLLHQHDGLDLDQAYAQETMTHVFTMWKRPVHIQTKYEDKAVRLSYDGKEHTEAPV